MWQVFRWSIKSSRKSETEDFELLLRCITRGWAFLPQIIMDVSYEAQSLHESQLTIFLTIWASQTTYLTSWCGLFSCFTYYYWAYSPTFSFFKIQAHNPYFLSIPIHEMASINYSPYLHKVGFGEMFKANLFSKYHELLGNESVMPINFFFDCSV